MKLIISPKYTEIKKSLPAFLSDPESVIAFKKIMSECDENTIIVFNFDGSYGQDKKKRIDIDDRFLSLLPEKGTVILNFSNISICNFIKTYEWIWKNLKNCEINFTNTEYVHLAIRPEDSENNGFCDNLIINTNEAILSCSIYNQNIKNLKILSPKKESSDHFYINNLMGCNSIDFSQYNNWTSGTLFNFSMINKSCVWTFDPNTKLQQLQRIHDYGPLYYNRLILTEGANNINGLTTKDIKTKFFDPKIR